MHCQEISPSDYKIDDIIENSQEFQEYRKKKASECTGCQYNCYIDAENTGLNRLKEIPKLDYRTKNVLFLRTLDTLTEKLERKTVNE